MTEEQIALGRRAVACKGWRWMPGMSICAMGLTSLRGLDICDHGRVLDVMDDDGMQMVSASEYPYDEDGVPEYRWADAMHIPDLGDPATLGCLLALVREAHRDPMASATRGKYTPDMVYVDLYHVDQNGPCRGVAGFGSTETEALVHALENAR